MKIEHLLLINVRNQRKVDQKTKIHCTALATDTDEFNYIETFFHFYDDKINIVNTFYHFFVREKHFHVIN